MKLVNFLLKYYSQQKYQNITWSMISKAIITVLFFAGDILFARLLKVDEYAEWAFYNSIVTILFYIMLFGIDNSSKIHAAKCGDDHIQRSKYIKAGLKLRVNVSFCFFIIMLLVMPPLSVILGYPQKYPNLKLMLLFGCFVAVSYSLNNFCREQFYGLNKFKKITVLAITEYGGYLIFGVIGIIIFKGPLGAVIGYFVALTVSGLVGKRLLNDEYDRKIMMPKPEFGKKAKEIITYAIPILIISFGSLILLEMDTIMLGLLGEKEDIALYSIAKKIVTKAVTVNDAYCAGVIVTFAIITSQNISQKEQEYKRLIIENSLLTGVLAIGMGIVGPILINHVYGAEYAYASILLLALMPYYIITGLSHFFAAIMDFQKLAKQRSIYFWVSIGINFILNLMLIPKWNTIGAALATIISVIPYALLTFISNVKMFRKYKITEL